ncbi:glycosyltransferase [Actinomyces procaprae]|uniref:glycosyltransferase n=1 Tax=Actinomyces procaprae TaxID=2560010 RepID=UPI001FF7D7CB|nr:glycosyltransferase [Actinomyces procaprae]
MREAFAHIGYRVFDLSGSVRRRSESFAALRARIADGDRPAFLYSENSTQPNVLATSVRTGIAPLLDYRIMYAMRRAGVPVGVFYRDAYWRVPTAETRTPYGHIANALQRGDLYGYRRNRVHFFLPSAPMSELVGLGRDDSFSALPPAGEPARTLPLPEVEGGLRLVYVGGLGSHYDLTAFVSAVAVTPDAGLELVTRESQWRAAVAQNPALLADSISAQHLSSSELEPVYARSHIGVLAVKPSSYRDIAVPVKLFEYLSYGRPVIATRGTEAGRIIDANGAGWVVDYSHDAFAALLLHLTRAPEEVEERAASARAAARVNTWADRARLAARVLTGQSLEEIA